MLEKVAVSKEKTGTVISFSISKGLSAHQFFMRYFSDLSLRTGMALISLEWSETGWRYLAMEVYALEIEKARNLVNVLIIGIK